MEKILQLYYNNNGQREAFPNEENPCSLLDFTYTAKRMGAAPTITASIKDARVIAWSLDVFVEFQGERYFLKRLPSSTYDNTDVRYKYDLEFVSERMALDNVFFFDVVKDKTYRGATRSTSFTFYGDIEEFVARMNYSLELSKVGYTVVIDDGVTSESKQLSFDGQYFSSVLQEVYNTYNLPYYFKGKEIHIGSYDTEKTVDAVLEYGANNSLLSISKTNANHMVVNRITGVGSSDNLPYYYPNETPLGKVGVRATQNNEKLVDDDCFKIVSAEKLQMVGLNEEVRFGKYAPNSLVDGSLRYQYVATDQKAYDFVLGWPNDKKTYRAWASAEEVRGTTFYYHYHFIIRGQVTQRQGGKIRLTWTPNPNFPNIYDQTKTFGERAYGFFDNLAAYESLNGELVKADVNRVGDLDCYIDITFVGQPNTSNGSDIELHLVFTFYKQIRNIDKEFIGDVAHTTFTSIQLVTEDVGDNPYYWSTSKRTSINLTDFGLDLTSKGYTIFNSNKDAIVGDGCYLVQNAKDGYITPQPNLMPPIYRENFFDDTKDPYFYNAKNNTYNIVPNDDTQGKYEFPNPFVEGRPQEYIQNFEDIRPSIKGLVDSEGNAIDQFINFAYDDGDNDSMDDDGTLMHPYFYAQLPRFTQDNEFNLFDHAIESGEMTISMTSGNCGACSFKIAVDKDSGKNTLQVDSNGNLLKDAKGNAVFGMPQDRQNDTVNFNVWVALFKDVDTFPSIMPNNHDRNKPKKNTVKSGMKMNNDGDTFVILNIDLPQAYILAAEKRLEHELIKFMHTNNAEKFNFSVKMSRIYLAEHPELLDTLNENSTVTVSYNNLTYPLLVSSFSYKMKEGDLLPEISIELADTLAIVKNAIQQAVSDVKSHVLSVVEAKDNVIAQNTRAFLRKDVDDQAIGRTTFENGFDSNKGANFGGFVESTKGAGIFQDENGNWHIESDFFRVRKKLSATSVEIEEAHHIGGHQMLTATSAVIDFVIEKDNAYRCFFRKDDPSGNSIHNNWMVGDQAYCKFFNIESAGEISNRYYWRAVTATNMTTTEELQSYMVNGEEVMISNYHFVDLSKTNADGEDVPMADDNIVQLGYQGTDDPSRQNAIIMAGAGEGSPYIRQYVGIKSFTLPSPDTQIKPGDNVFTGKISIQPGSTGLGNTQEWEAAQKDIEQAKTDAATAKVEAGQISDYAKDAQSKAEAAQAAASQAQQDANDAKQEAEDAKSEASAASKTLDDWAQDNVISPLEKQGVKDEKAFVEADKNDIDKQSERYSIKKSSGNEAVYTTFVTHYNAYLTNLTTIVNSTDDIVAIPTDMATNQTAYYTARTNLLERIAALAKKVADDAQTTSTNAQEAAQAAQEAANVANGALSTLTGDIVAINNRLDGVVENYFLKGSPTIANEPAKSWIDAWVNNQSKDVLNHVGDTYTNVNEFKDANGNIIDDTAGYSWRWCYDNDYTITGNEGKELTIDGTTYKFHWHPIADSDALKALEQAATAQAAADGKCATFLSKPTKPYQKGDLWILENDTVHTAGKTGEILTANTNSSVYIADHWKKLVTYTDKTAFNDFVTNTYNKFVENIQSQVDGKAQTWYQATQPSWTDDDSNHIGDLWYNTSTKKQYVYEGTSKGWQEIDGVPESVYDTIDGKANIFFTTDIPKYPYAIGDMWSQGGDSVLQICHKITETTKDAQHADDWEPADNTEKLIEEAKGELEDYTNDVVNGLTSGSQNLVRNGGFTGSYEALSLQSGQSLQSALEMYTPSLEGWDYPKNPDQAQAEKSTTSQTGKRASMWYNSNSKTNGYISQNLSATIKPSTKYVVSFSAYCHLGELQVTFGGLTQAFTLTNNWKTYHWKITTAASSTTLNLLKFEATHQVWISDIIVSEGSIPIDWSPSPYDNRSVMAKFQASEYLQEVLKVRTEMDSSSVKTGLVNTGMVLMGDYKEGVLQATTAGLSGTYNDDNSVAFFAGGDLEAAIYTAQTYLANPAYQPTEEEVAQMAKAVITHGGRAILNQAIVRGNIYADNGYFKGSLQAKMVYTEVLHLSGSDYVIDIETEPYTTYYCPTTKLELTPTIELPKAVDYKGLELSFLTDVGSGEGWALRGAVIGTDSQHGTELRDNIVYNTTNATDKRFGDWLALPKSGKMYKFLSMYNQTTQRIAWVALQPID